MGEIKQIKKVGVDKLIPYINNAKVHSEEQVTRIASSIREFGFLSPVLIDKEYNIIAGHGRVMAARKLGIQDVPCVFVEGLTDAQRKAYILADNRLGELADWDMNLVTSELEMLQEHSFDVDLTGFNLESVTADWFANHERNDTSRENGNEEYNEFLDKFEPKKTTDDCYTPDIVYDAVADWVANEYGLKQEDFVRPFFPGGDYKTFKYPSGGVVVDNPPFSILSEILRWYDENGIKFFLFAPTLTLFSSSSSSTACALPCGGSITYENGATVATSFVTNLENNRVRVVPDLFKVIETANAENQAQFKKEMPKYKYPDEVLTAAMCGYMSKHGVALTIRREDSYHIRQLESQKEYNDSAIYGSGYLLSEKAAAEKAAAHVWELSEKEKEIVKSLGNG